MVECPIGAIPDHLLWIDGKLIVQPGGAEQSIVALNAENGERVWSSPGRKTAYASLMPWKRGEAAVAPRVRSSCIQWMDLNSGDRLWEIIPPLQF